MKKTCDLLEGYLKGDLTLKEKADFERHLDVCSFCKKEVEKFKEIEVFLDNIKRIDVPDNFSDMVLKRIYEYKKSISGWYAYASIAIIVFASFLFMVLTNGLKGVVDGFVSVAESVYVFASSVLTAVFTVAGALYNVITPGKVNWVVLTIVFAVVFMLFIKSIKLFASVER